MQTIKCKFCGKEFEITEALQHDLKDQITKQLEEQFKADLEKKEKQIEEHIKKKLSEDHAFEVKDLQKQLEEKNQKVLEFREQESKLREEKRKLEEAQKEMQLEIERKLDAKSKELSEKLLLKFEEDNKFKNEQKDKMIGDLQKALEEANRKAAITSQQLQGEVLELDLEAQLKTAFAFDEILPVPKGVEGADIWQKVNNKFGHNAGSIIWELKKTKAWSDSWLPKLREDTRQAGATFAILITDTLPTDIKTFGFKEGIWVTAYSYALPLAQVLRTNLMQIAAAKKAAENKDEKLEALYQYLTSQSFAHRIDAQLDIFKSLKEDLDTEKRSMSRIWKKREMELERLISNTANMSGELEGLIGQSLPTIKNLELPQLSDGEDPS